MLTKAERLRQTLTPILVSILTVLFYVDTHSLHPILAQYARELGATILLAGVIVAAYSVFEDLFEFMFGYLMDKVGRRKLFLLGGLLGDGLAMLLYAFSGNPLMLLGARLFHGLSGSVAGPGIMSLTAEIPHPLAKLGAKMGLYGTSIILASVVGWVLGGLVGEKLGYHYVFYIVALLLFVGAILSVFVCEPEPLLAERETHREISLRDALQKVRHLLSKRGLVVACLGIFAHMMTMGAMTVLLPLRFDQIGLTSFHVGMTLAAYGVVALLFQIPMGYFSERYGHYSTIFLGLFIVSASMLSLSLVKAFAAFVVVGAIYGAGYSFLFPTFSSMIIENSKLGERATASSLFHIMFTQGVVLGAFLFAWVAQEIGYAGGLRMSALAPFLFLVILLVWRRLRIGT